MLPKLPLRIVPLRIEGCPGVWRIESDDGEQIDLVACHSWKGWPILDARQAAERRLAELTALIEAEMPKPRWTWHRTQYDAVCIWEHGRIWGYLNRTTDERATALCDAWNAMEADQ